MSHCVNVRAAGRTERRAASTQTQRGRGGGREEEDGWMKWRKNGKCVSTQTERPLQTNTLRSPGLKSICKLVCLFTSQRITHACLHTHVPVMITAEDFASGSDSNLKLNVSDHEQTSN